MSDAGRCRVRLWLKGEQAFGLAYVGGVAAAAPFADTAASHVEQPTSHEAHEEAPRAPARQAYPAAPVRAEGAPAVAAPTDAAHSAAEIAASAAASLFGEDPAAVAAAGPLTPSPALPAFEGPPLVPEEKRLRLLAMDEQEVRGCTRCRLCETRRNTVFGEGDADAKIFFIGEGPGENEDATGRPFVGKAGQLLDRMIAAMGLRREQVFIANVVKCRPPGNREPAPDEVATCTPYLVRQIETVRPRVIVTLGRPATQYMLQSKLSMSRLRGQWHEWRGIRLMPTFHPAYVLRQYTEQTRAAVWDDLKKVMAEIGLPGKR